MKRFALLALIFAAFLFSRPASANTTPACQKCQFRMCGVFPCYDEHHHLEVECVPAGDGVSGGMDCHVPFGYDKCYFGEDGPYAPGQSPDSCEGCDDDNQNGICDMRENPEENQCPNPPCDPTPGSPLVINMDGGPWKFGADADAVMFDLDGNGDLEHITWTKPNSGIAFLALDRNGNGTIDSGKELFGNYTAQRRGIGRNGFRALAVFDVDGDDQITPADPVWSRLVLWEDSNHDAISQPWEVTPLAASNITALGCDYKATTREDKEGNELRYKSWLWRGNRREKYFDVYFHHV